MMALKSCKDQTPSIPTQVIWDDPDPLPDERDASPELYNRADQQMI